MVFVEFQGWINTTVMFYAGYPASKLVSDAGIEYNLPLAYLLVGCSYFVCSLVMVVRRSVTLRSLLMILFFEATVDLIYQTRNAVFDHTKSDALRSIFDVLLEGVWKFGQTLS